MQRIRSVWFAGVLSFALALWLAPLSWAQGLELPAQRWLLWDVRTGQVLSEKNADERADPASITKVMTAYLVFEALREGRLKRDQRVAVSQKAWKTGGSRMFIEPRHQPTVEELLRGMIIASGNDATVALAEALAGTEEAFVQLMNQKAAQLGLTQTRFADASGWPHPEHYSTARDLVKLGWALIRDFPEEYRLFREKEFVYNHVRQPNRNRLLWLDPSVDGIKTGHTTAAGYCLLASAERDGRRLVAVTLGSASEAQRVEAMQKLLNYGFQFFEHYRVASANQALATVRVWEGVTNEVAVGAMEDLIAVLPRTEVAKAQVRLIANEPLKAPLSRGQTVGTIELVVNGEVRQRFPAVALADVAPAGWWGRLMDGLRLWWQGTKL